MQSRGTASGGSRSSCFFFNNVGMELYLASTLFITGIVRQRTEFLINLHNGGRYNTIAHGALKFHVREIMFNPRVEGVLKKRNSAAVENLPIMQEQPNALMTVDIEHVPTSLARALSSFSESSFGRQAFGDDVFEHYAHFYACEVADFERAVTDWELVRYFDRI